MIEVTESRDITEKDKAIVEEAEKAAREYAAEKELQQEDRVQTMELEEERYSNYGEMMNDAYYVYGCNARINRTGENKKIENDYRPCRRKKVDTKKIFRLKDAVIGTLLSGLLIVSETIPISALSTAIILFFTMAFTVSVGLFVTDNLLIKWLKGR